ncbi:hypothetical protein NBRC116187_35540 [Halopseudomonas sabulinigri]|uniref:Uncharacterized protein n=1 Tax=Halopseudomonas sabulinigri TaxID=472181 RepID=A0ABP9ZUP8_9GAMM
MSAPRDVLRKFLPILAIVSGLSILSEKGITKIDASVFANNTRLGWYGALDSILSEIELSTAPVADR